MRGDIPLYWIGWDRSWLPRRRGLPDVVWLLMNSIDRANWVADPMCADYLETDEVGELFRRYERRGLFIQVAVISSDGARCRPTDLIIGK